MIRDPSLKLPRSRLFAQSVRAEMARRGWSTADLADRCGISKESLTSKLSLGLPQTPLCLKLENILEYAISLGSDPQSLGFRRRCFNALAFDPYLESKESLRSRCEALGVRDVKSTKTTGELLEKFKQFCAANPKLLQPKQQ